MRPTKFRSAVKSNRLWYVWCVSFWSFSLLLSSVAYCEGLSDAELVDITAKLHELTPDVIKLTSISRENKQVLVEGDAPNIQYVVSFMKEIKQKVHDYTYIQKLTPQQADQLPKHFVIAINLENVGSFTQASKLSALLDVLNEEKKQKRITPPPFYTTARDGVLLVRSQSQKVIHVNSQGEQQTIFPPPKEIREKKWQGIKNLLVSPNQQRIAYTQGNDLWVYDVQKNNSKRLTKVGRPFTDRYISIEVLAKKWSLDGDQILYEVAEGMYGNPEGDLPDLEARHGPYGHYVYDLRVSSSREFPSHISIDQIVGWLENDSIIMGYPLCNGTAPDVYKGKAVRFEHFNLERAEILSGPYIGFQMLQPELSRSGKLFVFVNRVCKKDRIEILELNFETGKVSAITSEGGWAEYQWPKYSPDGTQIAYMHHQQISTPKNNVELMVDGKEIYSFRGDGHPFWIDNQTVALIGAANITGPLTLTVIDVTTGKVNYSGEWK
jgi:hypothetical protein